MKKFFVFLVSAAVFCACGTTNEITRESQYKAMYAAKPTVLLVMPPMNRTSYVEAKDLLYTSISKPLAEAGYYVISPFLAMDILKAESAYDAEMFVEAPLLPFRNYFGADAVVFSEILSWTKKGFGISTDIRYFIKMVDSGETVFDRTCKLYLDLQSSSSSSSSLLSLIVDVAASAINTAVTDHIVAARVANRYIFRDIPRGKYHPDFDKDQGYPAEERNISATVK